MNVVYVVNVVSCNVEKKNESIFRALLDVDLPSAAAVNLPGQRTRRSWEIRLRMAGGRFQLFPKRKH